MDFAGGVVYDASGKRIPMKTLVFACMAWTFGVAVVQADLTVIQTIAGLGQDTESTARFKDGKTRVDASPGTSLIMDLRSGEMINLMHGPKTFLKVSSATARAAIESMKQGQGGTAPPDTKPALVATGKKDTVGGFAADEYTCSVAGVKMTLWLTKALPDYGTALKEMSGALSQGPMGPLMQSYGLDMATLPGFPVRTVIEISPGQTVTRTVVSVSTQPIPDAEFEVPAGYKEMAVPVLTPPLAVPSPATSSR